MDIESEIRELKRRVGDLEGTVSVLTGQLSKVHPALQALAESNSQRFDGMEALIGRAVDRLDLVNTQVWSLRDDLPNLVASALRQDGNDQT